MSTTRNLVVPYYCLIAALSVAAIYCEMNGLSKAFTILKPLTTFVILFSVLLFASKEHSQYRNLIIVGLVFCLFGDTFLLNSDYFVYGLSAFLIAHLIFTFAFSLQGGFKIYLGSGLVILCFSIAIFVFLFNGLAEFIVPVSIYMLVISVMAWQGINIWIKFRNQFGLVLAIASLLFLFSDSVIAVDKFKYPFEWSRFWILSTYWSSISLIAYSTIRLNSNNH